VLTRRTILLTGVPGVGKTTVVRKVIDGMDEWRLAGFFTEEVRDPGGRRRGFRAVGLSGRRLMIASADRQGSPRVGRYGVDVGAVDELVRSELEAAASDADLYVIDEVGKMECLSRRFVAATRRLLAGTSPLLVSVAQRGGGFLAEVRDYPGALLLEVTRRNRDDLPRRVSRLLLRGEA
jgi:nucleoside-triphosphatase